MLKNPDSIKLWSDVLIIEAFEKVSFEKDSKEGLHTCCYFSVSGENDFGTPIKSNVMFFDGKYYCDLDDAEDDEEFERDTPYLLGRLHLAEYNLIGDNITNKDNILNFELIDIDLISEKLKIPYDEYYK